MFTPKSINFIYNPCDISFIKSQSFESLPVNAPQKYILHVGRAAKAKRHDVLFKTMKLVSPDYKLVCLSSSVKKLKKLGKKYNLTDRLALPGFQSNPYVWMRNADVVVLSSDFEGLSMVLLEAIISGSKIVSTDCPHGPSEILQGELSTFLVQPGDSTALAAKMNLAISSDVNFCDTPILEKIDSDKVVHQYLALIAN